MAEVIRADGEYVIRGSGKAPRQFHVGQRKVCYEDEWGTWKETRLDGAFSELSESSYDLIPAPKPVKMVPHNRQTWPGYRYVKPRYGTDAIDCGTVNDVGLIIGRINVRTETWRELQDGYTGSNHHNGPWERLEIAEPQP